MAEILVIQVGDADSALMRPLITSLVETFGVMARTLQPVPVPEAPLNQKRGQYLSTSMTDELAENKPDEGSSMLCVCNVDLYVPDLNFVFGTADPSTGTCIISLLRLNEEFYGKEADRQLLVERAIKEATHEVGHTFGLDHCTDKTCVMHFSNSIQDTDTKGKGFCVKCSRRLKVRSSLP